MNFDYIVSETKPNDIAFYFSCFSQNKFCEDYNIVISPENLIATVHEIALTPYRNLKRFVLYYKNKPISFCHFLLQENFATVSGGLLPELINSGKGVFAAIIFYDHYFKQNTIRGLFVEIKKTNIRSLKMHEALGFTEVLQEGEIKLELSRGEFPNKFSKQFLSKIKYESR